MPFWGLLANSQKLRQPEFVDLFQSSLELLPVVIILGKSQDVLASLLRQLGRQDQEICPNGIQGGVEESDDQIGGEIIGVALRNLSGSLNQPTKSELVAKTLKDYHSAEVSETGIFECETQYFQAFGHDTELKFRKIYSLTQTVQNGRFVSEENYSS